MNNVHSKSIPTEILTALKAKLAEANELIKPYAVTLTPDERHSMLKKGDKSDSFVTKSFEFSKTNPEFLPFYVNQQEFEIDITDASNLLAVATVANQIANAVDDTMMTAGSEAYYAALAYYNNVQQAASANVAGAKAIYDELKKRFPGTSRKADNTGAAQ